MIGSIRIATNAIGKQSDHDGLCIAQAAMLLADLLSVTDHLIVSRSQVGAAMPAFQVRIAYMTPHRRSRRIFHNVVLADDQTSADAEARTQLLKRSHGVQIVHQTAALRPDSRDAEAAMRAGWKLADGWWTRPVRPGDDLAAIASHGYANSRRINTRTTAGCVAIDSTAQPSAPA